MSTRKQLTTLIGVGLGIYLLRPPCLFHALTGLDCPGCGATRMVDALLHRDWVTAWQSNPFLLLATPVMLLTLWDGHRHPHRRRIHNTIYLVLCVVAMVFGVTRNL